MNLRSIFLLIPLLLLCLIASSFQNKDTLNTVLFKLTHPKTNTTSYLFGTHHAFGKAFFDTLINANQALIHSNLLITENLNVPGEMAQDIINARKETTTWKKYLNKTDLYFVDSLFAQSPTDYHKMTPTEMHVFLTRHFKQTFCLQKQAADTTLSLDNYIASLAKANEIKTLGLETTKEQIALINKDVEGMPRKVHKRRLSNIIELLQSENPNYCEETDWYANMQINYKRKHPCHNTLMLTNRNNKWITILDQNLQTQNCFIAVGLSHLMYECGLLNQLEVLGYEIVPVELNKE
ncbi:Uncharacterized conserved protein YbaP, TraB family [Lishizhenia tianjinensis]|uniref:Uncharacterized conserved protein YbaP, TraB family n=1 Tax=Lishizhenia tianjinensis TaxID=477690 RepID=A0A1I6YB60_9FLAO|nr:TraB/GumN family protein [Lishizhenia tianjinensis]SFT47718.1 Uncharacterized conserved protein YbaP, TraB family [Lishizhenia tianjinensis]